MSKKENKKTSSIMNGNKQQRRKHDLTPDEVNKLKEFYGELAVVLVRSQQDQDELQKVLAKMPSFLSSDDVIRLVLQTTKHF